MKLLNKERFCDFGQTIDYTQERNGAKSRSGIVGICPRCGKLGAIETIRMKIKKVPSQFIQITHAATYCQGYGFNYWSIDSHCSMPAEPIVKIDLDSLTDQS